MSLSFLQMADRSKLATDERSALIAGVSHTLKRQQLVAVPGYAPEVQGVAPGEVLTAVLANGAVVNAAVNAAATEQAFTYTVPVSKVLLLEHVVVTIVDTGSWSGSVLGALGAALTNGLALDVIDVDAATVLASIGGGKSNAELVSAAHVTSAMVLADTLRVEFDVRIEGWPLVLTAGQLVRLQVHDDLTGLALVRAVARGRVL